MIREAKEHAHKLIHRHKLQERFDMPPIGNRPPIGNKLIQSSEKFVVHSGRGPGECDLLTRDFVHKATDTTEEYRGLLVIRNGMTSKAVFYASKRVVRKMDYSSIPNRCFVNLRGNATLDMRVVTDTSSASRVLGFRYNWIGFFMIHDFADQLRHYITDRTSKDQNTLIRGTTYPPFMPEGTWTRNV